VRFRHGGLDITLTGVPWASDFMRQYQEALDGAKPERCKTGSTRIVGGSMNDLALRYYRSPVFRDLKASTQTSRRNIINAFCKLHGDKPVKGLGRRHIIDIIGDRADTPMAANNLLKCLRYLLDHAVALEMIETNPAIGVKGYRSKSDGHPTWTEDEVANFEARHPIGSKARLALALLLYTGQRKGDVTRMGWQHIVKTDNGGAIAVRQEKTDEPLLIPIHPTLASVLAAIPRTSLTFLVTGHGASFTPAGFGNWFREQCDAANLRQCSAHGLRKLCTVRLVEAGCTNEQIRAITGHRSDTSLRAYTRKADQARLARQAMANLGADREQKLSTERTSVDKRVSR